MADPTLLTIDDWIAASGRDASPRAPLLALQRRLETESPPGVWIALVDRAGIESQVASLETRAARCSDAAALRRTMPLFGVPFAVKDNIDVAGLATTAACPAFRYVAAAHAHAVEKLIAAGAVCVGKTNLDQFATGLVGTRSPYGRPSSAFAAERISGGSSSGSAVAVARGDVPFALGTDTAGSGRVPAAFNNLIGVKPSLGMLSTRGVVPACRSIDCVSIFAKTCDLAEGVLNAAQGFDPHDPFSRRITSLPASAGSDSTFRFGVPLEKDLEFFGNAQMRALYDGAIARAKQAGGTLVPFDLKPFLDVAELLYDGPWVAERLAAVGPFYREHPKALFPVIETILNGAGKYSAVDAFTGQYRLAALKRLIEPTWDTLDVLLLPTTGTIYTIDEVVAGPLRLNKNLGYYTNFVNLLDLCALAIPAGLMPSGLPGGVTLMAPAGADQLLLTLGQRFEQM